MRILGMVIGVACLMGSSARAADTFEVNWDRPGFDYKNFDLNNPREILCQWSCQQERWKCKAWTFVNPGVQGPKARCWLKWAVPRAVPSRCCTSGIVQ